MTVALSRRAFLAATVVAPALRGAARQAPAEADVVIIGGDPASYAAAWRLAHTSGLRVLLLQDSPAWAPAPAAGA